MYVYIHVPYCTLHGSTGRVNHSEMLPVQKEATREEIAFEKENEEERYVYMYVRMY